MIKKIVVLTLAAGLFAGVSARAEELGQKERHELAEAMESVKIPLEKGLALAGQSEGKAISGKFEIEEGKLQLSVYTEKDGKFFEVVVDHQTGKIAKVEAITEGEDLTAAKAQSGALLKVKSVLRVAVEKAVKDNKGFVAVSVTPSVKDGHASADVSLINDEGRDMKTVSQKLD
jgi:hypothetical protein